MLVGYMRVSSGSERQTTNLQRDALMAAGVDSRHLFEDHASGAKDDRTGLSAALAFTSGRVRLSRTVARPQQVDALGTTFRHRVITAGFRFLSLAQGC